MKKVLWIVRIIFGMSCAVATLGGVIMSVQDPVPENILLTVVCIVLAVLLLKKRKRKEPEVLRTSETSTPLVSVKTELTQPDVPEDTLRDMRKYYSTMQAENDARIMRESFQLCQQTFAYETFFSRLQLAERKALTLLQAKKAGCKVDEQMLKAAESVLSAVDALKTDFLGRIYTKETTEARVCICFHRVVLLWLYQCGRLCLGSFAAPPFNRFLDSELCQFRIIAAAHIGEPCAVISTLELCVNCRHGQVKVLCNLFDRGTAFPKALNFLAL